MAGWRIKQAARALGATKRCLELATAYSKQRVTFGQPIASRQAISFRLVDTYVALEAATLLVHRAAARHDRGDGDRNEAYMVKLYCTEMAWEAADMCLQVHGGIGLTTDLPVERLWRDQRSHMITEGTPEIMRMALARHVLNTFGCDNPRTDVKGVMQWLTRPTENILIEREGGITFLWLNRPDKRNAMSPDLHADMDDALNWLATDTQTKVLVLGGKGEAWCAGQDLRLYFRGTQDNPGGALQGQHRQP